MTASRVANQYSRRMWKKCGQGVERRTPDPETAGSKPTRGEIRLQFPHLKIKIGVLYLIFGQFRELISKSKYHQMCCFKLVYNVFPSIITINAEQTRCRK